MSPFSHATAFACRMPRKQFRNSCRVCLSRPRQWGGFRATKPACFIPALTDKVGTGDPDTMRRTLNSLLSCMDGLATEDGIIVVATANDPTSLGAALSKRPGRFDRVALFAA